MFSRYRVPLPQPVTDSSSPAFASQAEAWVRRIRKNYDDRANRHRIWYRSSGITVIVAGASLPVLTTIDYTGKNLAISLAGVLVAALTALRAFTGGITCGRCCALPNSRSARRTGNGATPSTVVLAPLTIR